MVRDNRGGGGLWGTVRTEIKKMDITFKFLKSLVLHKSKYIFPADCYGV